MVNRVNQQMIRESAMAKTISLCRRKLSLDNIAVLRLHLTGITFGIRVKISCPKLIPDVGSFTLLQITLGSIPAGALVESLLHF